MSPIRRSAALLVPVLLTLVSSAAADVPATASLSSPIKVPSMGGFSVGTMTMTVNYTASGATVTAGAPTVSLGLGHVLKTRTCLQIHVARKTPTASCKEITSDTRGLPATIAIAAPTVVATISRPPAGGSGYVDALVTISQRAANGTFSEIASSWTPAGLSSAGVPLIAIGATNALLPGLQGAALQPKAGTTDPPSGGENTGNPDSMCVSRPLAATGPVPSDLSTTALGVDAPAAYEVGEPLGGAPAKGVMLVLHGGGWSAVGAGGIESERTTADRWRARGWRTINATYRACGSSGGDALWFHDRIRKLYGATVPFCTSGQSAGGHLALMVAAFRSDVGCVVDEAGPTDMATLANERAFDPTTGGGQYEGPRWVLNQVVAAFGQENLDWWSPAALGVKARVLFAVATQDKFVPAAQGDDLLTEQRQRDPNAYVDRLTLDAGPISWVHASVSQAALDALAAREEDLVRGL